MLREPRTPAGRVQRDGLRPFLAPGVGYFVFLWLLLLIGGRSRFFRDPGSLWHPVVGRVMLNTCHFVWRDPFDALWGRRPWIARQWLPECALAELHAFAGLDGILLGTATLLAAFYAWLGQRYTRAGLRGPLALLLVMLAMLASSYHFHARPHLVTIVFLGWSFAWLCDVEAGRRRLTALAWLVPLLILWVNSHDGVVGGMATMGLVIAGWILWAAFGGGPLAGSRRKAASALALSLMCGLTALVNPYGLELPRTWYQLLRSPVLPQYMMEHAPLLSRPVGASVLALAAVYLAVLLSVRPWRPRVTWVIPLVWLVLALGRIRHGPLFAAVAAIAIGEMLPYTRWAARWKQLPEAQTPRPDGGLGPVAAKWKPVVVPAVLVLAAAVLQASRSSVPVLGRGWARLDPTHWPVDLLAALHQLGPQDTRAGRIPVFNEMLLGGFLIAYTPDLQIFLDDRCELYGDEALLRYVHAERDHPQLINDWSKEYGLQAAVTLTGSGFDQYLRQSSEWTLIEETPVASLYRLRSALARQGHRP